MDVVYKTPKKYGAPDLRRKGRGQVQYPVSCSYNGGITIDGDWYPGVEVDPPILSPGWKLTDIGIGLQLNAIPPLATMHLGKEEEWTKIIT